MENIFNTLNNEIFDSSLNFYEGLVNNNPYGFNHSESDKSIKFLDPINKDTLEIVKGQHPKIDAFLDKMAEISTHGTGYGGTVGFSLDANLAQLTPQNAYNNARNIFAAEEVIQNQGKRLNVKLNKALRNFNFTNIDEAADFLLSKANQKDWQPAPIKSNLIAEARNELDPGNDPRANIDYEKSRIKLIKRLFIPINLYYGLIKINRLLPIFFLMIPLKGPA